MREANNEIVKFNIDTGAIDPNTTPLFASRKNNFELRVSVSYAPGRTVFRSGFGIFVGPGQTEDQIQPIESDRISSTISNASYPIDQSALVAAFASNSNNRSFQPRAYASDYSIPERVYQYSASVHSGHCRWRYRPTARARPTSSSRVSRTPPLRLGPSAL